MVVIYVNKDVPWYLVKVGYSKRVQYINVESGKRAKGQTGWNC